MLCVKKQFNRKGRKGNLAKHAKEGLLLIHISYTPFQIFLKKREA